MRKGKDILYGFEDYEIKEIDSSCFDPTRTLHVSYYWYHHNNNYVIEDVLPVKVTYDNYGIKEFIPKIGTDHKELLKTAKSLYVHPSCKLSRTMLSTKYKKCLNPWTADAVVVPKCNVNSLDVGHYVLFINENHKTIIKIQIYSYDDNQVKEYINTLEQGIKFKDAIRADATGTFDNMPIYEDKIMNAELFYKGKLLIVDSNSQHIYGLLTNEIPNDKTVFEDTVLASLGSEENKVTFDNMTSIKDMLESSDRETVAAALKSLSMMDWMHYTNSVRYILGFDFWKNAYNPATNSTSVKYMLKTLNSRGNRRSLGSFENSIYEEDYNLFTQLKKHYESLDDTTLLNQIRYMNFMTVNAEGNLAPVIRTEAA